MSNHALLIAVENPADDALPPIRFATEDLEAFSAALQQLGFADADRIELKSTSATKTGLESDLKTVLRRLTEGDTFFLYYAGHGVSVEGQNYLTCHDTRHNDLAATSVSLQSIVDELQRSKCGRICLFLNPHHNGIPVDSAQPTLLPNLDATALENFCANAKHRACFVACRSDESSRVSLNLQRGVWTQHVIEALAGDAAAATFQSRYVTSASLQDYLSPAVARTIRAEFTAPAMQTPWMCGERSHEFVVADLQPVLEQKRSAESAGAPSLKSVVIAGSDRERVKLLSGFRKHFRLPDAKTDATDAFISTLSEQEMHDDLEATFADLKKVYRLKRLEIEQQGPIDGSGVILTPHFEYAVSVELDADDPTQVVWRREVFNISDPLKVFCDEFESVFPDVFDTIEITPGEPMDVAAVIDRIEELETEDLAVTYDSDATECVIALADSTSEIRVTSAGLFISDRRIQSPLVLLQSALGIHQRLTGELGSNALPSP